LLLRDRCHIESVSPDSQKARHRWLVCDVSFNGSARTIYIPGHGAPQTQQVVEKSLADADARRTQVLKLFAEGGRSKFTKRFARTSIRNSTPLKLSSDRLPGAVSRSSIRMTLAASGNTVLRCPRTKLTSV
jgi:hypothetical protein